MAHSYAAAMKAGVDRRSEGIPEDADLFRWLQAAKPPSMSLDDAHRYYQTISPRNVFMKSLPLGARMIDFGAGAGGTAALRTWPTFPRPDIRLFAIALDGAEHLGAYEEVFIGDFDKMRPAFRRAQVFDGISCCHCLEHLNRFEPALEWMHSVLAPDGRAYIEWPHHSSKHQPSRLRLIERGYDVSTINFFDDGSHIETWPMADIISVANRLGFDVEASGRILGPYLAERMRDVGIESKDQATLTFAIWLHVGFAQYVVLRKSPQAAS